jgi:hypothetical protein
MQVRMIKDQAHLEHRVSEEEDHDDHKHRLLHQLGKLIPMVLSLIALIHPSKQEQRALVTWAGQAGSTTCCPV